MKNLLVLQSGGPTAVINASLAGVIKGAFDNLKEGSTVFGALNGIEGVENERLMNLEGFKNENALNLLKQTPAAYLGSCRKKLPAPEQNPDFYDKIFQVLEKNNIEYVCCIGGNDSMDTTHKLSQYAAEKGKSIRVVGVPKTIDNDLTLTDHTPGYGSASKFVSNAIRQVALDAAVYPTSSIVIVEAMGRNAGWLTASAELANDQNLKAADIICLPERPMIKDKLFAKIEEVRKTKKSIVIAVSEGIRDENGNYIQANIHGGNGYDKFGHAELGGAGATIDAWVSEAFGCKTRAICLSTLQRCFSSAASLCDVEEAFMAGYKGAEFATGDMTGVMAGFRRVSDNPYKIEIVPFPVSEIANVEECVPDSMITDDGFGVTEEFVRYGAPLIKGEPNIIYENGVIQFAPKF